MISCIILLICLTLSSYWIYPFIIRYIYHAKNYKSQNSNNHTSPQFSTFISAIIIATHNESLNIAQTLRCAKLASQSLNSIGIYVADDGSTDDTVSIANQYEQVYVYTYTRMGKSAVIQKIIEDAQLNYKADILFLMDANIEADLHSFELMISHFNNPKVGLVGAQVMPLNQENNIEINYIQRENELKHIEGALWGGAIGVFGACYAVRSRLMPKLSGQIITDDLYVSFHVILSEYSVIVEPNAIVREWITDDLCNEFNRKKRYAAGNFYIFFKYLNLLFTPKTSIGFKLGYIFHKLIRWWSPVLWFVLFIANHIIMIWSQDYTSQFLLQIGYIILLIYILLLLFWKKKIKFGFKILYFLTMNWALLIGFFNYIMRLQTSTWQRSDRKQSNNQK